MDVDRAARIAALKQHPAWAELAEEVQETVDRYANALAKTMLSTGEAFSNFEYKRGVLAGMQQVIRYPESATRLVQKDIERVKAEEAAGE